MLLANDQCFRMNIKEILLGLIELIWIWFLDSLFYSFPGFNQIDFLA